MYISIDKSRLLVLHKHPNYQVVCGLVFIEAPADSVVEITHLDRPNLLNGYTDMELQGLYKALTGEAGHPGRTEVKKQLFACFAALPTTDALPHEVEAQSLYYKTECHAPGRYVKGAKRPGQPKDKVGLWCSAPAEQDWRDLVVATAAPLNVAAGVVAANSEPRPKRQHSGPSTPKGTGVRATIWEVADRLWEAAGKPADKKQVLDLRKRMMEVLETDHGVKRTSSSNELGNWQKARL